MKAFGIVFDGTLVYQSVNSPIGDYKVYATGTNQFGENYVNSIFKVLLRRLASSSAVPLHIHPKNRQPATWCFIRSAKVDVSGLLKAFGIILGGTHAHRSVKPPTGILLIYSISTTQLGRNHNKRAVKVLLRCLTSYSAVTKPIANWGLGILSD